MPTKQRTADAFLIDCYRIDGSVVPGVIIFSGRKRMEITRWKEHVQETQDEAEEFVRQKFRHAGLRELANEGELPRWQA